MRKKRLLLATTALALGCGGKKQQPQPQMFSNPKGTYYDKGLDAGVTDAPPPENAPPDAEITKPPDPGVYANTKGSLYDDGLAKKAGG